MDQSCAAAVDCAGQEGHADGFLVGDALEGANEIGAFKVLNIREGEKWGQQKLRVGRAGFLDRHARELTLDS